MAWRLSIKVINEIKTAFSQIFKVISKTIRNKSRGICIMHIKSFRPFCFKPFIRSFKTILLINLIINFIISKKFTMWFWHFIHQGSHILRTDICISIYGSICNCFTINKIINEIRIAKLAITETI